MFTHSNTRNDVSRLGLDIRLVTADVLLKLEKLSGKLDLLLEEILSVKFVLGGIVGVLLNVQANGGSR
jgi:hypothetical protein